MFEVDNEEETSKRHFCRRSLIFGGVQAAAFGLIGWRLFKLQVVDTGKYIPLAEENRINLQVLAPKRGRILDRRGVPLADNEESFRATLTPALAGDVAGVLTLFRRLVPITAEEAERIGRRTRNVEPFPGTLLTEMSPPCARTISRQMKSPRPVPGMLRSRWKRACLVNRRARSSCARP